MEQFVASRPIAIFDGAYLEIELEDWLEQEDIQGVTYSALDGSGNDATGEVVDLAKSNWSGTKLYPYKKQGGGVDGETYNILCQTNTIQGTYQEFRVRFRIREA